MNAIRTENLTKKYGSFVANANINLSIPKGEITAIVGENGAGKTTLMNMFYGLGRPTSGAIFVNDQKVDFSSPLDAIHCGLGMVHQHFKLVPSLAIYENIMLGAELPKTLSFKDRFRMQSPFIDKRQERIVIEKLIHDYQFELDPSERVENISIGAKQRVEILKMLYRNVDILIFDEPTAVLTPQEVDELLVNFRELKEQGKTILLITHKLREVMDVSDQVIVIRRGKVVGSRPTIQTSVEEIATMMVGHEVHLQTQKEARAFSKSPVAYQVNGLSTTNYLGKKVLDNISFEIREGEILGIAGVEGNGQSELVKVLSGLMLSTEGGVQLYGEDLTNQWPCEIRKSGVGIIPEDRYAQGLCKEMSLGDNLIAGYHGNSRFCKNNILDQKNICQNRDELLNKYDIRVADPEGTVSQLSGGNAQKVIIAREFDSGLRVLIASQPTRGVDIGSIEFIHRCILNLRQQNKAVLLISSELSEIMGLSDRILVMYKGKIVGEVAGDKANNSQLGLLMAGITK
ncbi:MAG TPA: ABC transporter ATP-binding protein [Firmicutes bacterium]|jgi:general nucleoside transport system ATP-binding protein|nr:ABC transporter ATP-binding protein [Bacillota bacterium]